jgi:hypothetical protein
MPSKADATSVPPPIPSVCTLLLPGHELPKRADVPDAFQMASPFQPGRHLEGVWSVQAIRRLNLQTETPTSKMGVLGSQLEGAWKMALGAFFQMVSIAQHLCGPGDLKRRLTKPVNASGRVEIERLHRAPI